MNGECKAYRLNNPMKWAEFKELPDDLKVAYIKMLREKYNAPTKEITAMMGVSEFSYGEVMRKLGFTDKPGLRRKANEAWYKWLRGVKEEEPVAVVDPAATVENNEEACKDSTDWKNMCEKLYGRAKEMQARIYALEKENKDLGEENMALTEENENMRTNPAETVAWEYHLKVVQEQKHQIDILRAKLEIVELIFGKR